MPLATLITGAYTMTYDAAATGITEDGYELSWEPKQELINRSDVYGDMTIDAIFRGTDAFIQTEFKEWKSATLAAAYPWATLGQIGVIGRLASNVAKALVLTATAGTPAAAAPATLTATLALLAQNSNPRAMINSRLRTLPCRFMLLPADISGTLKHFATT
jgi:hypothetical protein